MARSIAGAGVPVVNLRGNLPKLSFPFIGADNDAVARLAAEHLLARGFRNFAFCGYRRGFHPGMDRRGDTFCRLIEEAGHECCVFKPPGRWCAQTWEREQTFISTWVRSLPKPIAMLAVNDDRGHQVLDACRRIRVRIPDDVAVMGVDNDEYLCGLSIPPLTSIDINSEQAGYEAAVLLERLMAGRALPKKLPLIQPRGVITRQSTDVLAIDDPPVAEAIRYVRDNACRAIDVSDVVDHVGIARTTLRHRVKRVLGRSIHQEINRLRLVRIKTLLATTDMPIKQVARASGFKSVQYMTRVFKKATSQTPAAFRRSR
jgi:LacI family transcriptional regulator